MKRRILIIHTGGTIGMQPSEQGYVPKHWTAYDGFVILHGTDTMAYTASAL